MALNEIDIHRQMLLDAAKEHGLNSSETVRCSQELDALILKQMKKHLSDLRHSQSA
ncbi:aspartyl-phosphate phosphatase Spo0E family protein [Metabacillus idriensis]|uniref:aspartyl-phosphate phosphatase Spo0E family protein n=1 Tax=Metabacillus idriensis TaxID=324768 RepID=UPI00174900A5|nr:aspartyl-phosphate phosphatase Spo0E family protein [Metabacillus idriensis]